MQDNQPPTHNDNELTKFAHNVIHLALTHHGSITSYVRSKRRNAAVGGTPTSLHTIGLAADIVFDTPEHQRQALAEATALGLHYLVEPDHVHIQARPAKHSTNATRPRPSIST